jgi:hypothetical protein
MGIVTDVEIAEVTMTGALVGVAGWVIFRNGVSIKTAAAGGGILLILCSVVAKGTS